MRLATVAVERPAHLRAAARRHPGGRDPHLEQPGPARQQGRTRHRHPRPLHLPDGARRGLDRGSAATDRVGHALATRPLADTSAAIGQLCGFKVVHVFDVSQTDGEPLPDVEPTQLSGTGPDGLWEYLASLVRDDEHRIERGPWPLGANGYTDFTARVVRVRDDVDPAQAAKTLAHELGHTRADHEHRFTDYATSNACRGQAEVEAESIAYLIAAEAGLDAAAYSVPYLAGWSGGDVDLLRQSMTTVLTVAGASIWDDPMPAGVPGREAPCRNLLPRGLTGMPAGDIGGVIAARG